ncbi:MAG: class I SAM-dependent methyltransferase [Oscillospiraceae bacterium]|nr:class I SAM-dependent methyltransferase [Oscillospiraceae bacterium]
MNKQDVISFFDRLAPQWDADMIRSDRKIGMILDGAGVKSGCHILDVACGTGVLIPDYLQRQVASVTAIDISPEMVKIAQSKFPQDNVQIICGDVETAVFTQKFDCIMVYNAFPHFPEPEQLIRVLFSHLAPGGTLTIAHGMSRHEIDHHHEGPASKVSIGLMHEDALAAIMRKYVSVTVKISNEEMYQVTGLKI